MKLYSSNETNKTTTQTISTGDSLTTFFASKSEPIEILGDTTQIGTPTPDNPEYIYNVRGRQTIDVVGKNLLPNNSTYINTSGITFTRNADGSVLVNGTATANSFCRIGENFDLPVGDYILSGGYINSGSYIAVQIKHSDNTYSFPATTSNGTRSFSIVEGDHIDYIQIRISNGTQVDNYTFYPMVEKGNTATGFEPYINNTYEIDLEDIELNKIGDYKDRIFKSSGKNLFDESLLLNATDWTLNSNGYYTGTLTAIRSYFNNNQDIVYFKENTRYAISVYGYYSSGSNPRIYIKYTDGTNSQSSYFTNTPSKISIVSNANKTIDYITFYYSTAGTILLKDFQIEENTTASSYEPYGEPSWYIEKQISKWENPNFGMAIVIPNIYDGLWNSGETLKELVLNGIFSIYTGENEVDSWVTADQYLSNNEIAYSPTQNRIYLKSNSFSTYQELETLVNQYNTFLGILDNTQYIKIEDENLLAQLNSVLELYKGINNIKITPQYSSILTPQLKVEFKDGFTHNGLGIITDVLEANVTEQINGDYYLDFRVAINNKLADELTYNNIISCKVADGTEQFFRIKRVVKTFTEIQIYATHIFYDLIDNVLDNVAPTGLTCADYGRWLLAHTNYWTPFTFNSNMLSWNSGRYIRKNVVESMIGNIDNSMLVKFGGEIVRDNFDIALNYSRGNDNGVILRIGKNIKQIEITTDISNLATRIMPVGFDGLMIPEQYIDSPLINDYPQPKMAVVEFSDIKYEPLEEGVTPSEDDGVYHVLSEAEQALRDRVYALYNNGADKPAVNVKVDWLELSKTNQYSQYSDLEKVNIGDRITISLLGENYKSAVIKTTYNSLTDMIESFEIGSISASIVNAVNGNTQTIQNFNPSEILSSAASTANQQLINVLGGTYGYVGGFKIYSDKLVCEYYPPADFTQTDLTKLSNYLLDPVSNPLTPEEYELYDLKKDGVLNAHDLLLMDRLIQSGITTTNPVVYSMETGSNILDGGLKITDGNGNNIIQVGLAGYEYKGENITPDVYDVGDTYIIYNYQAGGLITTSTTRVFFSVPINGVVKNGTPKVSNAEVVLRGISGYLNGSEANGTITHNKSGYTWNVSDEGDHFNIYILKSSAYTNVSNNTPVSVSINSLEITFE